MTIRLKLKSLTQDCAIAMAIVFMVLLPMLGLDPWLGMTQTPFLLFFGAVPIVALYLGRQGGIIAGIGEHTAAILLSEIVHWSLFDSPRQLAAYAGLTPRERTSGSSVQGKPDLSRVGNRALPKALYLPAMAARRFNPLIATFCQRLLAKGKA